MWQSVSRRLSRWLRSDRERAEGAPTMIIPMGAKIERDARGRLCVRAPGNLVVQSPGIYGELESVGGSIRIEAGVRVEAALIRAAAICSVAGQLQAWRVVARELHVEAGGEASFVLRDTKELRVDPAGKVVGNFASEGELVGLFSRFAYELKRLPPGHSGREVFPIEVHSGLAPASVAPQSSSSAGAPADPAVLAAGLRRVVPLIEAARHGEVGARARILDEVARLLGEGDGETLRSTWRVLFERLEPLGEGLALAKDQLDALFGTEHHEAASGSE